VVEDEEGEEALNVPQKNILPAPIHSDLWCMVYWPPIQISRTHNVMFV